jgi:hypothetical protein
MFHVNNHEAAAMLQTKLLGLGFTPARAALCARLFVDAGRDGVPSHGLNRFAGFADSVRAAPGAARRPPQVYADGFTCFFSVATAWGLLRQQRSAAAQFAAVEVMAGSLTLREVTVALAFAQPSATLNDQVIAASVSASAEGSPTLVFDPPIAVHAGQALGITEASALRQVN